MAESWSMSLESGGRKLMRPPKLPISRSLTMSIPAGLSPTSCLDSGPLLSGNKAEVLPSTFNKPQIMYGATSPKDSCRMDTRDRISNAAFEFNPIFRSSSASGSSALGPALMGYGGSCNQQDELFQQVQGLFQITDVSRALLIQNDNMPASRELTLSAATQNPTTYMVVGRAIIPAEVASEQVMTMEKHVLGSRAHETESDYKETGPTIAVERSSDDGYNWRKYGQKHVKGCQFPRSYYKCTYPNCNVKKQLERSHDGMITNLIYVGVHEHQKPETGRRMAAGLTVTVHDEASDRVSSLNSPEAYDDNLDGTGVPSNGAINEAKDDNDLESRCRKKDNGGIDVTLMGKAAREPRVVVQTASEVDILDDGYRWRKYGKKVVKGNANPRSYYRCTNAECPVKKYVERSSYAPQSVITTYEGKHTHDVPAAKSNAHDTLPDTLYCTAPNAMLKTRPEEVDTINLDLSIGIGSSRGKKCNEMQ